MTSHERWAVRALAAASAILAAISVGLALAWREEHAAAACYRLALEEDDTGAAPDCGP
jgi:hypothetical protein